MSFWKKFFGTKRREDEPPPEHPDRLYVASVFAFDMTSEQDDRNWQQMKDIRDLPNLVNGNRLSEADTLIQSSLRQYPDFGFVHAWNALIWEKRKRIDQAREAYENGIKASKRRQTLCGMLAMLEFEHGTLHAAVRWWIRSILLQLHCGRIGYAEAFLYLSMVAASIGEGDNGFRILAASSRGPHGSIGLTDTATQKVTKKVRAEGNQEIREAIRLLTTQHWKDI